MMKKQSEEFFICPNAVKCEHQPCKHCSPHKWEEACENFCDYGDYASQIRKIHCLTNVVVVYDEKAI